MNRVEIINQLSKIFKDIFDCEDIQVNENMTANDINEWDSLTHITLIAEIEDYFQMKFSMKEVTGMKTVGEMIDIIEREIV